MKLMKKICLYISILLIFILYSCGDRSEENKTENKVSINKTDIEKPAEDEVYYDILLEDNALRLYEVRGNGRSLIKSVNIDISYYPNDDIEELKSGISAYSKESGFEILENFVN